MCVHVCVCVCVCGIYYQDHTEPITMFYYIQDSVTFMSNTLVLLNEDKLAGVSELDTEDNGTMSL